MHIIEIVWQAQQRDLAIQIQDIYQYQTIAELAQVVQSQIFIKDALPLHLADVVQPSNPAIEFAFKTSPMQQMVWREYRRNLGCYHFQGAYRIEDAHLSLELIVEAIDALVQKHPMLRTTFDENIEVQFVHRSLKPKVSTMDISALLPGDQQQLIEAWLSADLHLPFVAYPENEALFRCQIFKLSPISAELILVFHHSIIDGWSLVQLLNDLYTCYTSLKCHDPLQLEPGAPIYREFIALEQEALQNTTLQSFWKNRLNPALAMVLPQRTSTLQHELGRIIPPTQTQALITQAEQANIPLRTLCLNRYLDQIALLTGQTELTVGIVTNRRSNRLSNPLEAVGYFWNLLPLQQAVLSDKSKQLLQLQLQLQEMESHALYPLPQILTDVGTPELFFAVFNFVNFHHRLIQADVRFTPTYNYDVFHYPLKLTVSFEPTNQELGLHWRYEAAYFNQKQIRQLTEQLFEQNF